MGEGMGARELIPHAGNGKGTQEAWRIDVLRVTVVANEEMLTFGRASGRHYREQSARKLVLCSKRFGQAPENKSKRFIFALWKWQQWGRWVIKVKTWR